MTASYDCGIETNHQAWHAVHDGLRDGLTKLEIAARAGISYQMVGIYSRQDRPAGIVRRINAHHEGPTLCSCGRAKSWPDMALCQRCEDRRRAAEANVPARVEVLRSWATRNGRTPTAAEARGLLGVSRSRAGDMLIEAFGRDHRAGCQRRMSHRGWPEGAPDVPRFDEWSHAYTGPRS
jgi:hypothetical protein